MRRALALVVLLVACSGRPSSPPAPDAAAARAPQTPQEKVLMLDAALKHHEKLLRDLESRGASADEIEKQRKVVEAVRMTLEGEERRLKQPPPN